MTKRWRGAVSSSLPALAFALAVGCDDYATRSTGGDKKLPLSSVNSVANGAGFLTPFDSAPSPDGSTIYFTGVDPAKGPAVFSVSTAGGTAPAVLASGCATAACDSVVGAPVGIAVSSDGATVYVADPAYATSSNDSGSIFSVPSAGGAQSVLAETSGYNANFITVAKVGGSDNLVFIGNDKVDGQSGIFKDVSGAVSPVIKGVEPQAAAVAGDGTVYYLDQAGSVQKLASGDTTAKALGGSAKNLAVSYPAGMALTKDDKFLLVPVIDPASGNQAILRFDAATGALIPLPLALPAANTEGGGFHRAANADIFSFVDSSAGATGTVYVLQ